MVSGRGLEGKRPLSRRWGYDRDANPRYFEDFLGEGVVVDDLNTETPDERTVDRSRLKKGINARTAPSQREEREEERDYY